jgi:hypothetical protein
MLASLFGVSCTPVLPNTLERVRKRAHLVQAVSRLRDDVELELALHLTNDQIRVQTIRPSQNKELGRFNAEELLRKAVKPG